MITARPKPYIKDQPLTADDVYGVDERTHKHDMVETLLKDPEVAELVQAMLSVVDAADAAVKTKSFLILNNLLDLEKQELFQDDDHMWP